MNGSAKKLLTAACKVTLLPLICLPYFIQAYWEDSIFQISAVSQPAFGQLILALGVLLAFTSRQAAILLFPSTALICSGLALWLASQVPLIIFPAALTLTVAVSFLRTLLKSQIPLVEQMARRSKPNLLPEVVAYCRRVTFVWGIVLSLSAAVSVFAWFVSPSFWRLYNGFISYVLFATVFALELIFRTRLRRRLAQSQFRSDGIASALSNHISP